jgi:hypothetical protein
MALHHSCHNLGTRSVHSRVKESTTNGWLVPSWREPAETPMRLPGGAWVLLTGDGKYLTMTPDGTARVWTEGRDDGERTAGHDHREHGW